MNEVIEVLCEKFNTTAETLIATMSEYYLTSAAVTLLLAAISAIVFIATAVAIYVNEHKKSKKDNYCDPFDDFWIAIVFGLAVTIGLIALIISIVSIGDVVLAVRHPEAYAIRQIIQSLK